MNIFEQIILGLIQGLTEFIPISSSGHLVIAQNFLTGASDHLFLEYINIGTTLALIVFFWNKIIILYKQIFKNKDFRLGINILLTAIPAGVFGFLLVDFIERSDFFGSLTTVAVTLASVGLVMVVLEKIPRSKPVEDGSKLTKPKAFAIGLAQSLALIPGVSRSGATIIAGRLSGLSPSSSAEYSFLAAIPIMLGVTAKVLIGNQSYLADNLSMVIIGNITAFIAGILAIGFLMKYLSSHSLAVFGWYRLGLASVLAVVILLQ